MEQTQKLQRRRVVRVLHQKPAIERRGRIQITGLMICNSLLQQGRKLGIPGFPPG